MARILHVDDDPEVRANVAEYLAGEEIPGWGQPVVVGIERFDEALAMLETERFDLVVLDLRLGAHDQDEIAVEEEAGIRTLDEIRARRFVPIIFWTGLPQIVRGREGPLVSVLEKTRGLPVLLDAVRNAFATNLPAVNRALLELVEEEQRSYMWGFVSANWSQLRAIEDHMALAYLLARRLGRSLSGPGIERLAVALGESTNTYPPDGKIHPMEMYIQPPLDEVGLQTGDLLRGAASGRDGWWMVLTPSCDLEHKKADHVLVAAADPLDDNDFVVAWRAAEGRGQRKTARRRVEGLISQKTGGQDDRWLYLPAAAGVPDLVIDMQRLHALARDDVDSLSRVASLDTPFAEAAINRFGRYFGRVGTADLDVESIMKRLDGGG